MKKLLQTLILLFSTISIGQVINTGGAATNIKYTTADVTFFVNPQSNFSNARIIYIPSPGIPSYTNTSATIFNYPSNPIAATQNQFSALAFLLTGLTAGTTYNYVIELRNTTNTIITSTSAQQSFTTLSVAAPSVNNITNPYLGDTSVVFNYSVTPNGANATSFVRYGTSSSNLNLSTPTNNTNWTNNNNVGSQSSMLTGLTPGTTYYYSIRSNNSAGITDSPSGTFTTINPTLLYHFPFDNSRSSVTANPGTYNNASNTHTYVDNGLGNTTGALRVSVEDDNFPANGNFYTANLPLLPQGRSPRTIIMRVKFAENRVNNSPVGNILQHYVVSWGSSAAQQSYGFSRTPSNCFSNIWSNDRGFGNTTVNDTWYTLAITFRGDTGAARFFLNGTQVGGINVTHATPENINTTGTTSVIGRSLANNFGNGKFDIDDLKIYSGIMTDAQIATLSNAEFNLSSLKFNLYPNPANSILNIDLETELKSVEIYSLQGQKVLSSTSKQINISNLTNGIYLVRVEDIDGAVATQKLIKNN